MDRPAVIDPGAGSPGFDDLETLIPDAMVRYAVSESQGREGIGRRTLLEIILVRP